MFSRRRHANQKDCLCIHCWTAFYQATTTVCDKSVCRTGTWCAACSLLLQIYLLSIFLGALGPSRTPRFSTSALVSHHGTKPKQIQEPEYTERVGCSDLKNKIGSILMPLCGESLQKQKLQPPSIELCTFFQSNITVVGPV